MSVFMEVGTYVYDTYVCCQKLNCLNCILYCFLDLPIFYLLQKIRKLWIRLHFFMYVIAHISKLNYLSICQYLLKQIKPCRNLCLNSTTYFFKNKLECKWYYILEEIKGPKKSGAPGMWPTMPLVCFCFILKYKLHYSFRTLYLDSRGRRSN